MIKKIISIKNIGKIVNAPATQEFKKLNIIYGENGTGKTTICAVMKSLKTGNTDYIKGRASFHSTDSPSVNILHERGNARLNDAGWDTTLSEIEVFDSSFTSENVHAGHNVTHEHKKSLHDFVIGEEGIRLTNDIRACDGRIREINSTIQDKERAILRHIQGSITVDDFVALPKDDEIDIKISEKNTLIKALEQAETIKTKGKLNDLQLPSWDLSNFKELLERTLEDISKEAEELIKKHIDECLDDEGEQWLSYGFDHVKDSKCPFCGQGIDGIELVKAYQQYFNEAYTIFKTELLSALQSERDRLSMDNISTFTRLANANDTLLEYWQQHISIGVAFPQGLSEQVELKWKTLAISLDEMADNKAANLLEKISLSEALIEASGAIDELRTSIKEYNSNISVINAAIQIKKDSVETGDLQGTKKELIFLQNKKKCHERDVDIICTQYISAKLEKALQERIKEEKKQNLNSLTGEIISRYQEGINNYLMKFGADFKIVGTATQYTGGTPSVSYKIQIGKKTISVGDARTPQSEPSFRNTLSDGDKSTLAFAFFMSKLDLDPAISEKVIVLDDPINSLDIHRRKATVQEIVRKAISVKQIVLLTHDPVFARTVYDSDRISSSDIGCFCLKRDGDHSTVQNWDIGTETASDFYKNYCKLEKYIIEGRGDPHDVAKCIRPVLEGHLRRCFPTLFKLDRSLGQYLGDIRSYGDTDSIGALKRYLEDLSDINEYAVEVGHDDCDSSLISDQTIKSYITRTLGFMGR